MVYFHQCLSSASILPRAMSARFSHFGFVRGVDQCLVLKENLLLVPDDHDPIDYVQNPQSILLQYTSFHGILYAARSLEGADQSNSSYGPSLKFSSHQSWSSACRILHYFHAPQVDSVVYLYSPSSHLAM